MTTEEAHPGGLNEFQARHVEATFAQIDRLLGTIETLGQPKTSPFARERADISPEEARFLGAFAQQMRSRMIAALDRLGVPRPRAVLSARNTAGVTLRFAQIALADLSASSLRGYGALDPTAAAEVEALASDIEELIGRAHALFQERDTAILSARLAELAGPFGEVLRELEKMSARHALLEIRPLIAEAADRISGGTFDIGVFGRVGAGKSSLINALVGSDVLPVGALPVTAVPLRLHQGPSGALVSFENGAVLTIGSDEIARYATESGNPGNSAGVRAMEVSVPSLTPGIRFLDTPGVGSLSRSGPAQAFAWLPRCDLGLVLIAAGTAISSDDLALLSGLIHAGIDCQVLISKSDLLKGSEIADATSYVLRELAAVAEGFDIPIHTVSTAPTALRSIESFRREVLDPLAEGHAAALDVAIRKRLHRLVAIAESALAESILGGNGGVGSTKESDSSARDTILRHHLRRNAAVAAIRSKTDDLAVSADRIVEAAASAVASAWLEKRTPKATVAAARTAIVREVGAVLSSVRKSVAEATGVSKPAAKGNPSAPELEHRIPPIFDAEILDMLPELDRPGFLTAPRHTLAVRRLSPIRGALINDLTRYAARLYAWGQQALTEVQDAVSDGESGGGGPANAFLGIPEREALARLSALIDASAEIPAPAKASIHSASPPELNR